MTTLDVSQRRHGASLQSGQGRNENQSTLISQKADRTFPVSKADNVSMFKYRMADKKSRTDKRADASTIHEKESQLSTQHDQSTTMPGAGVSAMGTTQMGKTGTTMGAASRRISILSDALLANEEAAKASALGRHLSHKPGTAESAQYRMAETINAAGGRQSITQGRSRTRAAASGQQRLRTQQNRRSPLTISGSRKAML